MNNVEKINIIEEIKKQKYETRKYHLMARHLELLAISSDIESIKILEQNKEVKPYIRYIGGIGGSRSLEFCVAKECNPEKAIITIQYILDKLSEEKKKIPNSVVNGMMNVAIMYNHLEMIDFLLTNKKLKEKVNFRHQDYMIIKNMLLPNQTESKHLLKKMVVDKIIPLDEKTRSLIIKSKDESMLHLLDKIAFKEKIENHLVSKVNVKSKIKKI